MPLTIIDWGSVADWFSGIGSLAAAVVALYIALYSQRVKLRAWCGHRIILTEGSGEPQIDMLAISAINISPRPTTIANINFTYGDWRWKKYLFVKFERNIGNVLPTPLSDGETGSWYIPIGPSNQWARGLIDEFKLTRFSVDTLRVQIHTSNGGATVIRPEKEFRDTLTA
jgi:hypothetical protein